MMHEKKKSDGHSDKKVRRALQKKSQTDAQIKNTRTGQNLDFLDVCMRD